MRWLHFHVLLSNRSVAISIQNMNAAVVLTHFTITKGSTTFKAWTTQSLSLVDTTALWEQRAPLTQKEHK